ncbi:LysE family translocator [Solwaraspora sp. WMMD1047]|uniref:LysE family translocator n=1 Tax=Solwaraspora sp. WMMD1047 TaxID=3016102 RepID=UPI002417A6D0|nr:LysE family translocator [Solwaraspora sp. WMMD1047]MDG4829217.1 LysE family translocator [Solwaraspora sp. WMMD1047]
MVDATAALGIALVALGLVLTPGPNMIYLISRTLAQGRTAGLVSLLGVAAGFLVYLVGSAAGLTTLFALVPPLYDLIRLAGAGYLLWLAWQAVRSRNGALFVARQLPPDPPRRLFLMGLLTNLLNPKIAVLYISLLPQFIDPARGSVAGQGLLLGLTQIVVAVTVNCLIVVAAGRIAGWLAGRPGWLRIQQWFMASVLGALAVRLLTDRARPVPAG